ncbi:hypothetical protein C8R45DRAFT_1000365 [Mycena sanguinolenta]|nr:hypothetical protein C8R45DRAFT_1000365 [Mycena sanguinolenta]
MPPSCSQCGALVDSTADFEFSLRTDPQTMARLGQLGATNEPPHDTELSLIRPILGKTSARLADLDAEILRLQIRLLKLEKERIVLARVPAEILGEIFSWTLPSLDDVLDPDGYPWVLTHVCGSWRSVALSKPSLWSLIRVDFTKPDQHYPADMVRTQMKRARSLKIHFYGSQAHDSAAQITLFMLLGKHCDRWEELSIQLTSHLLPHVMDLHGGFTALRRAWVQWDTAESQVADFDSIDFFQMAISLVDINVYSEYRFIPTRLPLVHQLTRYDLDAPWQKHSELLKSLPNLQEVCISLFDDPEDWPDPGQPIYLPHLRRVHVTHPRSFDYLRTPALREIGMLVVVHTTAPWAHLEGLFLRSACSPRRLRIKGVLNVQCAADFLHKYQCLTEVAITPPNAEEERTQREVLSAFIKLFTISPSTPAAQVLPHITSVGFGSRNADAIVCPLFLDMLESRWNVRDSALTSAELLFVELSVHPDPRSVARIEALRAAGLQLSLLSEFDARDRVDEWLHKSEWV